MIIPHYQEAAQRIRRSIDEGTPVLDFSDLCLQQLPPELAACDHVHTLYLGPDLESEQWKKMAGRIDWSINLPHDLILGDDLHITTVFASVGNIFQTLKYLPRQLRHLYCWNNHINTFRGLPPTLETLTWVGNRISELRDIPPALSKLTLRCKTIKKLENLPASLLVLSLPDNQISKIENLPDNLQLLELGSNQISKIENLPHNLQLLELGSNQISKLENLPDTLLSLHLDYNQISKLENLPIGLQSLNLSYNSISKLENLLDNLQSLNLSYNQISEIENLPNGIQSLNLSGNQISKLENLPETLQSLHLSDNQISKLENLPDNLQSLNLWNNQISKLENLPDNLQSLNLNNNQISKLENLPHNLQSLDLRNNQVSKLENLPDNLQSLNLWDNQVSELENLPIGIQSLKLGSNQITRIENLPIGIQSLKLGSNQITRIENLPIGIQLLNLGSNQITRIENLPIGIQSLNLGNNQITRIENLPDNLQSLNLWNNQISKLENLPDNLQSLNLWNNQISKLENLPDNLQSLNLWNNQISKLENLPDNLQSLNLWDNQINKLENLPDNLQSLNLNNNQISKLENLPDALQSLNLWYNQISNLENLPHGIQSLHLNKNRIGLIENLPGYLVQLSLEANTIRHVDISILPPALMRLGLEGNPATNVPTEILRGDRRRNNCLPDLKAWFADLELGAENNKQLKLLINGNGNVGKSSVLAALKNGRCTMEPPSTHAISLDSWPLNDIQFKVWDFGGQEIFHGTHRMFLTSKAVNLVVFDSQTEQLKLVPDRINPKELTRNHKITYWYNTIRELNPESPIIITQNKIDERDRDISVAVFAAEQGCIFTEISATTGRGIEVLKAHIADKAKEIPDYNMPMPTSWQAVRQRLADNLALLPENENRLRLCPTETFYQWCTEAKVLPASQDALLRYLHHTGNLYQNPEHLKGTLILDQMWALDGIYALLDRKTTFYSDLRDAWKGKVRVSRLLEAWGTAYTLEEKRLFLRFLESCGQCFNQTNNPNRDDSDWYIFPEFLDQEQDRNALAAWEEHCKIPGIQLVTYRYKHPFLHFYRIQQIIVELGRKTSTQNIWKNGIQIHTPEGWLRITANYEEHAIEVEMEPAVKNKFLREILELVQGHDNSAQRSNLTHAWEERNAEGVFVPARETAMDFSKPAPAIVPQKPASEPEAPPAQAPQTLAAQLPDNHKKDIIVLYAKEYEDELVRVRRAFGGYYQQFNDLWCDKELKYDEAWQKQILTKIKTCDGIIFLVGEEYFSPDKHRFIREEEIPAVEKKYQEEKIPVACMQVTRCAAPDFFATFTFYDKASIFRRLGSEVKKEDFIHDFVADFVKKFQKQS